MLLAADLRRAHDDLHCRSRDGALLPPSASLLGFTAAVLGGWVDMLMSRFVDLLMAIPTLIFALVMLSVLPANSSLLILVMAHPRFDPRLSPGAGGRRSNIDVMDFVEAARLRGEGSRWIIFREILPNALSPLISEFGLRFCFDVPVPRRRSPSSGSACSRRYADWGGMVKENKDGIVFGIAAALTPAAAIAALAISRQSRGRLGCSTDHRLRSAQG